LSCETKIEARSVALNYVVLVIVLWSLNCYLFFSFQLGNILLFCFFFWYI